MSRLVLLMLAATLSVQCYAKHAHKFRKIDKFVQALMKCRSTVPGLSLAMVSGDESFSKGYGFVNVGDGIPTRAHHTFPIGSLTKGFTSTILAFILAENKSLTWDTPIKDILGETFRFNTSLLTEHTSIRDLLAHRTGIPSYFEPLVAGYEPTISRQQAVSRLRFLAPTQQFRTQFTYSNHIYNLAGYVAEQLAGGVTWEQMVREKVFRPLDMRSAGFVTDADHTHLAEPYVTVNGSFVKVDRKLLSIVEPLGPAGSIKLSADDAVHWLKFQLTVRNEVARGGHIRSNMSFVLDTHSPIVLIPGWHFMSISGGLPKDFPVQDTVTGYGMGWMTNIYRGTSRVSHTGNIIGLYSSQIWIYPEEMVGIYTATNGPAGIGDDMLLTLAIQYYASDVLMGKEPWLNISSACSLQSWFSPPPPPSAHSYTDVPQRPLSDYVGTYGHLAFGNVSVTLNETTNQLNINQGQYLRGTLLPVSEDVFSIVLGDYLEFLTFGDGLHFSQNITFSEVMPSGIFNELKIPMEDIEVRFMRGLKLTDKPTDTTRSDGSVIVSSSYRPLSIHCCFVVLILFIFYI